MRQEQGPKVSESLSENRIYSFDEKPVFGIVGRWFDTYRYTDGSTEPGQHGEFEWGWNQIQNSFATLLAAWCRAEPSYDRIAFLGVGSGLVGWDTVDPTLDYDDPTLEVEIFRKAIPQGDIGYLDPITSLPTGGTPSSKIEIDVTLLSAEANTTLREFGLFGGTATIAFDSGQMVNWVFHSRIDKDVSLEIQRKIRIEFQTQ